ncbi:148_t:CDS:2 [Scutellospora calospora]|uniref:148_t:CDS:1 n=1 Tax=Scutellospora calospora TaxID=85575 RepID=A0ACA9KB43_9GLOM|nr:148_t:CDS:2 [Scutellospora calospora]
MSKVITKPAKNKYKKGEKVQITKSGKEQTNTTLKNEKQQRKLLITIVKVQITIFIKEQTQEKKETPKHQTWQRTNTRKSKATNLSEAPNLAKNKYKKEEKVQSTILSNEPTRKKEILVQSVENEK